MDSEAAGIVTQGVELMLFGMGTVVVFLALLVCATWSMSYLLNRYFPSLAEASPESSAASPADAELVAVISAAVHQHRSGKQ